MRAAHLTPTPKALRASANARAFPLLEDGQEKAKTIPDIIKWLNVEKSARYQPTEAQTFCNIYAYDVCYLAGVYLPRVWWTNPSAVTDETPMKWGVTVAELNANALYQWLCAYGSKFGWQQVASPILGQELANQGHVVVVCAAQENPKRSGHISIIVPGELVDGFPVQSQAGRNNCCSSIAPGRWWLGKQFGGQFGIWSNSAGQST